MSSRKRRPADRPTGEKVERDKSPNTAAANIVKSVRELMPDLSADSVELRPNDTFYFDDPMHEGQYVQAQGDIYSLELNLESVVSVERRIFDDPVTGQAAEAWVVLGDNIPKEVSNQMQGPYGVIVFTNGLGEVTGFQAKAYSHSGEPISKATALVPAVAAELSSLEDQ